MKGQSHEELKNLLEAVPTGFLVDSTWLEHHGIGRRSSYAYVQRGWLERLGRGVFRRPAPGNATTNTLDWKTCLLSLQHIMHYPVHVGGATALGLQGYAHYLSLGDKSTVWLYGAKIRSTPNSARAAYRCFQIQSLVSMTHEKISTRQHRPCHGTGNW